MLLNHSLNISLINNSIFKILLITCIKTNSGVVSEMAMKKISAGNLISVGEHVGVSMK